MNNVVEKLSVTYDDYKMVETIYSNCSFKQIVVNTKNKPLHPTVINGPFKSTNKQLRRYLKYLVTNNKVLIYNPRLKIEEASYD